MEAAQESFYESLALRRYWRQLLAEKYPRAYMMVSDILSMSQSYARS